VRAASLVVIEASTFVPIGIFPWPRNVALFLNSLRIKNQLAVNPRIGTPIADQTLSLADYTAIARPPQVGA
jgi:hypothetical protein